MLKSNLHLASAVDQLRGILICYDDSVPFIHFFWVKHGVA